MVTPMIRQYNFDHSQAIVAGAIYQAPAPFRSGSASYVHNGMEPSHIVIANLLHGAEGTYFALLVTAQSPAVVREKMAGLKTQLGIAESNPLKQPPGELETELAIGIVSLQAKFEQMKGLDRR